MTLIKIVKRSRKRLGRGYGSGKGGHTSSRGQKGQKSRRNIPELFEGTKTKKSLLRRLPQLRGKDKFKGQVGRIILNVQDLNKLPSNAKVNMEILEKYNLIRRRPGKLYGVKILGTGKLTKKLTVALPVSAAAERKIKKVGGSIEAAK